MGEEQTRRGEKFCLKSSNPPPLWVGKKQHKQHIFGTHLSAHIERIFELFLEEYMSESVQFRHLVYMIYVAYEVYACIYIYVCINK